MTREDAPQLVMFRKWISSDSHNGFLKALQKIVEFLKKTLRIIKLPTTTKFNRLNDAFNSQLIIMPVQ